MLRVGNSYNNYTTQNAKGTKEPRLSTAAKNVLEEIRKTYGDMDIMVYQDGKDAKELLSRSTKEFSVMLSAEELEKMASDEKYKKERMNGIQGSVRMSEAINEKYGYERGFGKSVAGYYSNLQKNYSCLSQGNVSISSQYLKECAGNASKAKELEDFLEKIPELEKQGYEELAARNKALGGTVTHYQQSWVINKDGSIQSTVYSVTETEETNAERLKRQMDERLEKQKEKKEEAEKAEKAKEAKEEQKEKLRGRDDTVTKSFEQVKQSIEIKYVEADSKEEALAMQNKEKVKDAYRPVLDVSI